MAYIHHHTYPRRGFNINSYAKDVWCEETEPLLKIRDACPKILIARTKHELYDYQGIKVFDLAYWLKDEDLGQ